MKNSQPCGTLTRAERKPIEREDLWFAHICFTPSQRHRSINKTFCRSEARKLDRTNIQCTTRLLVAPWTDSVFPTRLIQMGDFGKLSTVSGVRWGDNTQPPASTQVWLLAGSAHQCGNNNIFLDHCYRIVLLFRTVTVFSLSYRVGTTISGLKVEPSVPGHRARTKEGPLVLVGVTNRD